MDIYMMEQTTITTENRKWRNRFVLCIFPVGVICGLLSLESGSMWPCAFLHAAHNNYDQAIFDVITRGDDKLYFVSETGVFTIVCVWIIVIIMFVRFQKRKGN